MNVDYTQTTTAILIETPIKKQDSFNVYSLEFQLRAINLTFKGVSAIPTSMRCIWNGWVGGYEKIGRDVIDTYYNDNCAVVS